MVEKNRKPPSVYKTISTDDPSIFIQLIDMEGNEQRPSLDAYIYTARLVRGTKSTNRKGAAIFTVDAVLATSPRKKVYKYIDAVAAGMYLYYSKMYK